MFSGKVMINSISITHMHQLLLACMHALIFPLSDGMNWLYSAKPIYALLLIVLGKCLRDFEL